jgi:uncharacterized membrane protein
MLVFRIVHILAGVAWAGSVVLFVVFVQPSAGAIGPAAGPFMSELLGKRRLTNAILGMAAVSIIGGLFLYWHDWHVYGSLGDWVGSRFGLAVTIGAIAGIAAFLIGLLGTRPRVGRFLALSGQAAEAGGPPPAELVRLQTQLKGLARTSLALIGVSVLAMSTARYW